MLEGLFIFPELQRYCRYNTGSLDEIVEMILISYHYKDRGAEKKICAIVRISPFVFIAPAFLWIKPLIVGTWKRLFKDAVIELKRFIKSFGRSRNKE